MTIRFVRRASAALRPAAALAAIATLLAGCAPGERALGPQPSSAPRLNQVAAPRVVISQVYGGGGNSGATYRNDFIELFNAGDAPQSLAGWSVQYASASGTSWQVTQLTGSIEPGQYYLVQQAQGTGGTEALPGPNATGTIPMSGTAGKIALVASATALTGGCPSGLVDLVGYGTANCFEGSGGTPAPSNTLAVVRAGAGCTDTGDNAADFRAAAPAPRNSATTRNQCAVTPPNAVTVAVGASPVAFGVGQSSVVSATVTRSGGAVTPTSITWSAEPAAAVTFASTSTNPVTVTGAAAGPATLTASVVVDGQTYTGSVAVTVTAPPAEPSTVRVSELHYDNEGADEGEAVEVEGNAGQSLDGWKLVLYNRTPGSTSAQVYLSLALSGTIANQCGGRGTLRFDVPADPGLQNGTNDGIALVNAANQVVELLSYEGTFTATEGPAAGLTATDVGVVEGSSTQSNQSLQRTPGGTWFGPANETFGLCNPATVPTVLVEGYSFRGATPIPAGFGELYRFKDLTTNAFIRSGVTWTTTNPAIASVDALGNVTARAAGETFVTATETATGRTSSQRVRVVAFAPIDESVYADELQFGVPTDKAPGDDLLVNRATFAASWSAARGQPNWVAYNLEQTHRTGAVDRCDCFAPDPLLPAGTPEVNSSDYDGSGYSRGHMTMSADRTRAALDNATTFYFSNIIPQTNQNNGGAWLGLEQHLGSIAAAGQKEVFVFAGGAKYEGTLNGAGRVAIPTFTWKVAVLVDRNEGVADVRDPADVEIIAVAMPNTTTIPQVQADWPKYKVTVDSIEALTGYDLLSALPDNLERIVESGRTPARPVAKIAGAGLAGGPEGSTLAFDASETTDPDLGGPLEDILSYAWAVDGVQAQIGPTFSRAFGDNGTYEIRLIVSDVYGLADTTTTMVTVANVSPAVAAFAGATIAEAGTYAASGSFADPGADQWTATVNYGDGGATQPLALDGRAFSLRHTYADNGSYTVTVTVTETDAEGGGGTQTATVVVNNVAPTVAAFAGATLYEGETYTATGGFTDPGTSDTFTGTVNYGFGAVALPLDGKAFSLSRLYETAKVYSVQVTITDKDGGAGTRSATVDVRTPVQGVADLTDLVSGFAAVAAADAATSAGTLDRGELNALLSKLQNARDALQRGSRSAGVNALNAFVAQVRELVADQSLTVAQGDRAIALAQRVIRSASR